ncbi:hypothetical protein GOV04_04595 [Candidatus Woesearchaeota archaeon]|nr:hypothetical protein [Candidatus Woesearchaeota archaeon]
MNFYYRVRLGAEQQVQGALSVNTQAPLEERIKIISDNSTVEMTDTNDLFTTYFFNLGNHSFVVKISNDNRIIFEKLRPKGFFFVEPVSKTTAYRTK